MITEEVFLKEIAKIILGFINDQEMDLTKEELCRDGHFSPKMLTLKKLLHMRADTLMRLFLYLATMLNEWDIEGLFADLADYINEVANNHLDSAYEIIDNHAGSPINGLAD